VRSLTCWARLKLLRNLLIVFLHRESIATFEWSNQALERGAKHRMHQLEKKVYKNRGQRYISIAHFKF